MGRQDYQWKHEPCLYGWKDGAAHYFVNKRNLTTVIDNIQEPDLLYKLDKEELIEIINNIKENEEHTTVLKFDKPSRNGEHPTMKPVELFTYQILNSSKVGDVVLDTFMGSGTTLIACEKTQRKCYGVELDPHYVDVIIQRWVNHTGVEEVIKNGQKTIWQKTK
jgi:DNA modification methylase